MTVAVAAAAAAANGVFVSDAGQRLTTFGLGHYCRADVDVAVSAVRRRSGEV